MKKLLIGCVFTGLLIAQTFTASGNFKFLFNDQVRRAPNVEFVFEDGTHVEMPVFELEFRLRQYLDSHGTTITSPPDNSITTLPAFRASR